MPATEYVVLVDKQDQAIGKAEKLAAHQQNLLHRAFSVFIFRQTSPLELLLQQRAMSKYHSGGLWTNTCCSHPRPDETVLAAGERRLQEEFGFSAKLKDLGWFHYNVHFANGLAENEIDHVLLGIVPAEVNVQPHPAEIHAYQWQTITAIRQALNARPENFTPWFAQALEICCAAIKLS